MALDYLRSHKNKFDFFSVDLINLIKTTKDLTKTFNQKKLTTDLLLLAFFSSDSEILTIFNKYNISFQRVFKYISYGYELENFETNRFSEFKKNLQSIFPKKRNINEKIQFNFELNKMIEKAIENCYRFKTPVLTPEIVLLTFLEEKNNSAGQILKSFLKDELQWNLFRYEILKKVHNQESKIQGNIPKSSRYFAYLLKTELTDLQFEKLLKKDNLTAIVLNYRDLVVHKLLALDLYSEIEKEIKYSIRVGNTRTYKT